VTTEPGSGSRRQTSSDGPIISISANPTRRDLTGRTYYPLHGDGQRPNAAYPTVHNVFRRITAGQRALVSKCVTLCLLPAGAAPHS
jgi:hypothetical protein